MTASDMGTQPTGALLPLLFTSALVGCLEPTSTILRMRFRADSFSIPCLLSRENVLEVGVVNRSIRKGGSEKGLPDEVVVNVLFAELGDRVGVDHGVS